MDREITTFLGLTVFVGPAMDPSSSMDESGDINEAPDARPDRDEAPKKLRARLSRTYDRERAMERIEMLRRANEAEVAQMNEEWTQSVERDKVWAAEVFWVEREAELASEEKGGVSDLFQDPNQASLVRCESVGDGIVAVHGKAEFSRVNVDHTLDPDDRGLQQMLWERLPLSESQRREIIQWATGDQNEPDKAPEQAAPEAVHQQPERLS